VRTAPARLPLVAKIRLVALIWVRFVWVWLVVRGRPLPNAVRRIGTGAPPSQLRVDPGRLGRIVNRSLTIGPWQPRCLFQALVLYRGLRAQGDDAELVIGLPRDPKSKDAHAWVEFEGRDVGPPPGRGLHEELARYR
jgi:Transglutaminase-like superfamily